MNTTTNTTHADRIFSPRRIFAPAARYFGPQAALTESMPCSASPARLAGPPPRPARPGVGWLRLA